MTIHAFLEAPRRRTLFAAIALGLVLGGSAARAQSAQTTPSGSDAAQTPSRSGADDKADQGDPDAVVIHGQRRHAPPAYHGSPAEAEAAGKQEAWRAYRDSTPAPTPGACPVPPDPAQGAGCGTLEGSETYPGLRNVGQ